MSSVRCGDEGKVPREVFQRILAMAFTSPTQDYGDVFRIQMSVRAADTFLVIIVLLLLGQPIFLIVHTNMYISSQAL
jgi:hypothetical protein